VEQRAGRAIGEHVLAVGVEWSETTTRVGGAAKCAGASIFGVKTGVGVGVFFEEELESEPVMYGCSHESLMRILPRAEPSSENRVFSSVCFCE
jgi:hypothetical protein